MKKLRKIHIDDEIWCWVAERGNIGEAENVRIYSPNKKMYRIDPNIVAIQPDYCENHIKITPGKIKEYITKNLK